LFPDPVPSCLDALAVPDLSLTTFLSHSLASNILRIDLEHSRVMLVTQLVEDRDTVTEPRVMLVTQLVEDRDTVTEPRVQFTRRFAGDLKRDAL